VRFRERAVAKFRRATRLTVFGEAHLQRIVGKYAAYLQCISHSSLAGQGCPIPSGDWAFRRHHITACARRPSSSILQKLIFGTHNMYVRQAVNPSLYSPHGVAIHSYRSVRRPWKS